MNRNDLLKTQDMKRDDLLAALDNAHHLRTYGGNGYSLYKQAADEIRHLVTTIESLKERLHFCNEYAVNLQNMVQVNNAIEAAMARTATDET